ncbi:hypothetical protein BG015_000855 [Linnemannia schmuckeri]|uniref:F-box domain-containing protein n=1 Tax=Linnemannia schmuckeri TaxID=64567 RepID=A0A9P5RQI5_9FUNG|nr:hypothetical protein BG015_000855 [Linnemannia schmuckeri]
MTSTNKGALLPCNKVFTITELLESVLLFLDRDSPRSPKVLVNVCRLWKSLFGPYVWRKVTVREFGSKRLAGFRRHGQFIRDLTCYGLNRDVLKSISSYTPNLEKLYLHLDRHSIWVTHDLLERAFSGTQSRLTTVSIYFDATVLNTRLLWSLSRLERLENLTLVTERFSHDLDEGLCKEILGYCKGLKSFTVENSYTNQGRIRALDRLQSAIQGKVISMIDRMPGAGNGSPGGGSRLSLQVLGATRSTPRLLSKALPSIPDTDKNNDSNNNIDGGVSNLKRLRIKHFGVQASRLIEIFKCCSQLEELDTQNIFYEQRGSEHWSLITKHCQQLRTLRMSGRSDCFDFDHIAKLIICHPQLDAFYMHLNTTNMEEWRSLDSNLAACAKEHHGQQRYPLKTLSIKGYHKETLSLLLEVLSIQSLALETLIVGSPWFFQIFLEHSPGSAFSTYESLAPLQSPAQELFDRPWHTLKQSLTRLDISTTIVADRDRATLLFHRLQELENLRALRVSAHHVLDFAPEPHTNTICGIIAPHDKIFFLPEVVEYTFPSLLDFIVREDGDYSSTHPLFQISVAEAVYVIATMPALQYFHLGVGSVEERDLERLKWAFPDYFMAIPKSRLDWISDDSS